MRSYFYWEKHCFDVPVCWSLRSIFDALDSIDKLSEKLAALTTDFDVLDSLMPQLQAQVPPEIASMKVMKNMTLSMHSTMSSFYDEMDTMSKNSTALGKAFDTAKNDDSFYIPPEVFDNADFQRGEKMFLSPDGKAARFIISHEGNPDSPEGISHVDPIKRDARPAVDHDAFVQNPIQDVDQTGTSGHAFNSHRDTPDGPNERSVLVGKKKKSREDCRPRPKTKCAFRP